MTIFATTHPLPHRRGPRGAPWIAKTVIDGTHFRAQSPVSPNSELARVLVNAGIADQPIEVTDTTSGHTIRYPSFHRLAKFIVRENASDPIRTVKWSPPPDLRFWATREAPKQG